MSQYVPNTTSTYAVVIWINPDSGELTTYRMPVIGWQIEGRVADPVFPDTMEDENADWFLICRTHGDVPTAWWQPGIGSFESYQEAEQQAIVNIKQRGYAVAFPTEAVIASKN